MSYVTTPNSSSRLREINWICFLINTKHSLWCKWSLFYIQNSRIVVSLFFMFVCFETFPKDFVLMMWVVSIKDSNAKECAYRQALASNLVSSERFPRTSLPVNGCRVDCTNISSSTFQQYCLVVHGCNAFCMV